ncbi:hypothetical protein MNV49_002881 [Pseudohyphozyma bogoriensis]|nr:hypothetical protein MNV49_002881 [Pseudohyphozyma bogoriensis]
MDANPPPLKPSAAEVKAAIQTQALLKAQAAMSAGKGPVETPAVGCLTSRLRKLEWKDGSDGRGARWSVSKGYVEPTGSVPSQLEVNIATYNVWFDATHEPQLRWTALFDLVFLTNNVDIVCLQEITSASINVLLARADVRNDWIVVDGEDVLKQLKNWYGCTILVRREWMSRNGLDKIEAGLTPFGSPMGRGLVTVEVGNVEGVALRIATSHFESGPTDFDHRRNQFYAASRLLSFPSSYTIVEQPPPQSPLTIPSFIAALQDPTSSPFSSSDGELSIPASFICGDTNIETYDELKPLLDAPASYVDCYREKHPCREEDVYGTETTFGTTYPLKDQKIKVEGKEVESFGRDAGMYPSDHNGVLVRAVVDL